MRKPALLTSANVRRKGEAQPAVDAVARGERGKTPTGALVPLSFKVPPEFKKRYRTAAAVAELKLNEFLFMMLDRYESEKRK